MNSSDSVPGIMTRVTARVLPVSAAGDVLLLLDQNPARPGEVRWGTIGGAVDPGETILGAAVREMFEETGIVIDPDMLTPAFHRNQRDFEFDGVHYAGDNTFFALPLEPDEVDVSFEHLVPEEVGNVFEARWWSPANLAVDGRLVTPDLCEIMTAAILAVDVQGAPRRGQL